MKQPLYVYLKFYVVQFTEQREDKGRRQGKRGRSVCEKIKESIYYNFTGTVPAYTHFSIVK